VFIFRTQRLQILPGIAAGKTDIEVLLQRRGALRFDVRDPDQPLAVNGLGLVLIRRGGCQHAQVFAGIQETRVIGKGNLQQARLPVLLDRGRCDGYCSLSHENFNL
jgi:hypothetical protein